MLREFQGPPSMAKIAAIAGVSPSTVSRALLNHTRISKATRDRIRKLARDLNYRINPAVACSLTRARLGKPSLIGATLAYLEDFKSWNEVKESEETRRIIRLREGVMQRAQELGYGVDHLLIGTSGYTPERLSNILEARGIQGIILAPSPHPHRRLQLNWDKFAIVALGETLEAPQVNRVSIDHFGNLQMVLRQLLERRYERVGFVLDSLQNERNGVLPFAAFKYFQATHPEIGSVPILAQDSDHACLQWLKKYRPDVVITYGPQLIFKLHEWGYSIPDEIGFVTLERPGMEIDSAGAEENSNPAGATAVDLVVAAIHANDFGPPVTPKSTLVQGNWIDGPTLRDFSNKPESLFARAIQTPPQNFITIDLLPYCNRRMISKECFFGNLRNDGLPLKSNILPGQHVFHGIPFQIAGAVGAPSEATALMMASQVLSSSSSKSSFPSEVQIPIDRKAVAIYFLHGCGWTVGHQRIGRYTFCYADDSVEEFDVVTFYKKPATTSSLSIRTNESSIQDHSVFWEQFENDKAKPVKFPQGPHAWSYKVYFYAFEWTNPRPQQKIKKIVITTEPDQTSSLAIVSITLVQPDGSPLKER